MKKKLLILFTFLLILTGCSKKDPVLVAETTQETTQETKQEAAKETKKETEKETVAETKKETQKETVEETKAKTKKETQKEVVAKKEEKPAKVKKEPVKETKKETKVEAKTETKPIKKKTNEEIAKEVLNGQWGSGQTRKDKLTAAGYNYSEIQAIVNKKASIPVSKPIKSNKKGTVNTKSAVQSIPNNSILINGVVLRVSNNATQAGIDAGGRRIVNWGVEYMGNKTVGGPSAYFALHNRPYGYLFKNASSFVFKDINGNVKTYNIESRSGIKNWQPEMRQSEFDYTRGAMGDRIAVQTCINMDGSSRYRVHVFR